MQLKILTPVQVLIDLPIQKVDVETLDGFFTLLPRHIDFVNVLKPTVIQYMANNKNYYVACNKGVIVKKDDQVCVSTPLAIQGDNLEKLKKTISIDFKKMEEDRKEILVSISRLEIGLTKGLMALNQNQEAMHV